jgi:NADH-quinone oxidoreductase subunit I
MKRIEEMGLWERLYFPEIFRGMMVTGYHFWRNLLIHTLHLFGLAKHLQAAITIQYPDERLPYPVTFRGRHRLTLKSDDSVQCTACFLCATACPADCINIVAGEYPENPIEKFPIRYEIDTLVASALRPVRAMRFAWIRESIPAIGVLLAEILLRTRSC